VSNRGNGDRTVGYPEANHVVVLSAVVRTAVEPETPRNGLLESLRVICQSNAQTARMCGPVRVDRL
jgi:hypothetical protein